MLQYLLRRFLLSLPALWLLVTLVFLLSRLLAGAPGSEQVLLDDSGFYSKGSNTSREQAYKKYLKRTGLDLPLFYFSVKTNPEPDSLSRVYPDGDQVLLRKLYWQYGNSPAVYTYFKSIKELGQAASSTDKDQYVLLLESLHQHTDPEAILSTFAATDSPDNTPVYTNLKAAAINLTNQGSSYTYLLPSFRWHGTNNQYHTWLSNALQGNLGTSYRDGRPVHQILLDAIGNTWWLILGSLVVAFALSFELAMVLTLPQNKKLRKLILPALFILDSIPLFLLALLLMVLLATPSFLQIFPVYGMGAYTLGDTSWIQRIGSAFEYMALPAICLILTNMPYLTNLIFRSFSEESRKDYVRTAKAKGLSIKQVIRRHMLRNTLLPSITVLTDALPALVAGAIVVETIFAIPGVGRLLVQAVLARDYPVIVAIVLLIAVFRVVLYLLADIGYTLADPRIKHVAS